MRKQNLFLLLTAFIWGFDFVAQHVAMDSIGPAYFSFVRFLIAGTILLVFNLIRKKKDDNKDYIKHGIVLGIILFLGSFFQQYGLITITPGKSGFISSLYIVFVPLMTYILNKEEKPTYRLWIAVIVALIGLYLLTYKGSSAIGIGDFITVLSAFVYSLHIIYIDKYAGTVDIYKLNCVQFYTSSIMSLICMLVMKETFSIGALKDCLLPLIYVGVIGTCVSYTTQTLGQKDNDPTIASLIMSLESVFAALSGFVILHNVFTTKELIGCIIIFSAIIYVQLPVKKKE